MYIELERQKDNIDNRSVEVSRLKSDLQTQNDIGGQLQSQKKQLEEDLHALRERNRDDATEIDHLTVQNDKASKQS